MNETEEFDDESRIFVIKVHFISRAERDRALSAVSSALDQINAHCSISSLEEEDDGE